MKRTGSASWLVLAGLALGLWAVQAGCDLNSGSGGRPAGRSGGGDASSPLERGAEGETQHTILLAVFMGSEHPAMSMKVRDLAAGGLVGADQLQLVHKEDRSELYLKKTYRSVEAAYDDLKKAKAYVPAGASAPLFPAAMTVPVPPKEVGPAELNLKNATWQYEYTILVGEFEDSPENFYVGRRVKDSVEYCRELRRQKFDAYYYHGPARSMVTIGLFPETAMQMVQVGTQRDRSGQLVPVLKQKVTDPMIEKIMTTKEPPLYCLAWNGRKQYRLQKDEKGKVIMKTPIGSEVIQIPRTQTERARVLEARRLAQLEEMQRRNRDRVGQPEQVP